MAGASGPEQGGAAGTVRHSAHCCLSEALREAPWFWVERHVFLRRGTRDILHPFPQAGASAARVAGVALALLLLLDAARRAACAARLYQSFTNSGSWFHRTRHSTAELLNARLHGAAH